MRSGLDMHQLTEAEFSSFFRSTWSRLLSSLFHSAQRHGFPPSVLPLEDVAQESFFAFSRQPAPSSSAHRYTYLMGIAMNKLKNEFRLYHRSQREALAAQTLASHSRHVDPPDNSFFTFIEALIRHHAQGDYTLQDFQQLADGEITFSELAARHGVSPRKEYVRFYRIRDSLRASPKLRALREAYAA